MSSLDSKLGPMSLKYHLLEQDKECMEQELVSMVDVSTQIFCL
jgi:hypothetical protein